MKFEITVKRKDTGAVVLIEEENLEEMFSPHAQIIILKAYAKHIEEMNEKK